MNELCVGDLVTIVSDDDFQQVRHGYVEEVRWPGSPRHFRVAVERVGYLRTLDAEGRTWARGHLDAGSAEVVAMKAARAL